MTEHTTTMTEAAKVALQLQYGINDEGTDLTATERETLVIRQAQLAADPALDNTLTPATIAQAPAVPEAVNPFAAVPGFPDAVTHADPEQSPEPSNEDKVREAAALFAEASQPEPEIQTPVEKDPLGGIDPEALAEFINLKVGEALASKTGTPTNTSATAPAAPQQGPATVADLKSVLQRLDPRDSDAALEALSYLTGTGRLNAIGNLAGGGYLFHYQEPKGTTKEGYMPGGTKGGRMVDQALEAAEAQGLKPIKRGVCPACMNAVIEEDDGSVVLDDETKSAVCSAAGRLGTPGAGHVFVG